MFTGIIEEVGEIESGNGGIIDYESQRMTPPSPDSEFRVNRVRAGRVLEDMHAGASIAVNGVCLTVRALDGAGFSAELSRETLDRTSLWNLGPGAVVNLERPMRADGRFDGHLVQGHVDGLGRIRGFDRIGDNWRLDIEFPEAGRRYIVEKGSVAIDGISLTVARVDGLVLTAAIIPHTLENTNLKRARPGDPVNLEFDILAKYVERMLANKP